MNLIATLAMIVATQLAAPTPNNLINWKVGDTTKYNVAVSFIKGTNVKSVTSDEGTSIWVRQNMDLMVQKQVVDIQMNKADGKILKMLVNGKEQAVPNDKVEVISQDYAKVTVPAGTFDSIHIIAKTEQISKIEVWANPRDTAMDGTLKQIAASQMGDITMELTSFSRN